MTKSKSESRLRYLTASVLTVSDRASSVTQRSARRATVRAKCSWAATGEPPGRIKLLSGAKRSLILSISVSSHSTWLAAIRSAPSARRPSSGVQRSAPRSNTAQCCIQVFLVCTGAGDFDADKTDHGVGFVDCAVGFDSRVMLRDTAAVAKRCLSLVAAARVYFCQLYH